MVYEAAKFVEEVREISQLAKEYRHQGRGGKEQTLSLLSRKYGIAERTLGRYIRLGHLSDDLLYRVSTKDISVRTGVELSYLSEESQKIIVQQIEAGCKITYVKACTLRKLNDLSINCKDWVCRVCEDETENRIKVSLEELIKKYDLCDVEHTVLISALEEVVANIPKRKVSW